MNFLLILFVFITSIFSVYAQTSFDVVYDMELAKNKKIWKKIRKSSVPKQILKTVQVDSPEYAFTSPFPDIFFQNKNLVVCYVECFLSQEIDVNVYAEEIEVPLKRQRKIFNKKSREYNNTLIRQATVYFWVNELFKKLETLDYAPSQRLHIKIDRVVNDPVTDYIFENNAFYNPEDRTLSFLPADNSFLYRLLGYTFRPSAYDPSVAIHEAGHFVFDEIYGRYLNSEIGGLNEGFADYLAMITLDTKIIGQVMMSGKPLRNAAFHLHEDELGSYQSEMPVHDLGSVYGKAFMEIREITNNNAVADLAIVNALKKMSVDDHRLYHNAFTFPRFHIEELKSSLDSIQLADAIKVYEKRGLWQQDIIANMENIKDAKRSIPYLTISSSVFFTKTGVFQFGMQKWQNYKISLLDKIEEEGKGTWYLVSLDSFGKTTAFWMYVYQGNIISVYDFAKKLVNNDHPDSNSLMQLKDSIASVIDWHENKGAAVSELVDTSFLSPLKLKYTNKQDSYVSLNGELVQVKKYEAKVVKTFIGRLAGVLGKEVRKMLNTMKEVNFYTIKKEGVSSEYLPEIKKNELLIGYEIRLRSGVLQKVMIEGFEQ